MVQNSKDQAYQGPERRANPFENFDCERHCPAHGRMDEKLKVHKEDLDAVKKCVTRLKRDLTEKDTKIWGELDDMKEKSTKYHESQNRRIGDMVPMKHAIAAISILLGLFGWMMKVNGDANKRVAEATVQSSKALGEKIDKLTGDVATMKAVSAALTGKGDNTNQAMVNELRRMNDGLTRSFSVLEAQQAELIRLYKADQKGRGQP